MEKEKMPQGQCQAHFRIESILELISRNVRLLNKRILSLPQIFTLVSSSYAITGELAKQGIFSFKKKKKSPE